MVGLKLTALHIDKHTVRGNDSLLQCKYDLQDESLYSVKWYKDGHEFYRFVPRDFPVVQVFPVPGVYVDVSTVTLNLKLVLHRSGVVYVVLTSLFQIH